MKKDYTQKPLNIFMRYIAGHKKLFALDMSCALLVSVIDLVFPYVQQNVDRVLALEDGELVEAFLDIMERHKMIVENAGLLTVAALKHLDCKGKNVVSVLSGGNMDVITMSSLVQHGLIGRGRIFTFAVQLPDRPGELMRVADVLARNNGNFRTTGTGAATRAAQKCGQDVDMVVCCGGDGTLNETITGLLRAGASTPLGYIPTGTTNDFAASMG